MVVGHQGLPRGESRRRHQPDASISFAESVEKPGEATVDERESAR
jgi:hypothetical protein